MIELKIDGEVYTKKQYEKDYVRMMDSIRCSEDDIGEKTCGSANCDECPIKNYVEKDD